MKEWAERQLRTSKLVQLCTKYILQNQVTYSQIYGLCKLTWITKSGDTISDSYIKSTKLPGLSLIFQYDFLKIPYEQVGAKIAHLLKVDPSEISDLVFGNTGYTNFYNAYRNSSEQWIYENFNEIHPLISIGIDMKSDDEAESIATSISKLPKIKKANNSQGEIAAESLLTPLFFSLDHRLRFPLINGNIGVYKLLNRLNVKQSDFVTKFSTLVSIIGKGDILTAIDLDCLGEDLPEFTNLYGNAPKRKLLKKKRDKDLTIKDEADVVSIKKSLTTTSKRLHNKLTNLLIENFPNLNLQEGNCDENMFDVLVKSFNNKDLLIEVKSTSDMPNVRMAVGQLMDYSRQLKNYENTIKAVLLPEKPNSNIVEYLEFCKVKILWLDTNYRLCCNFTGFPFSYFHIK